MRFIKYPTSKKNENKKLIKQLLISILLFTIPVLSFCSQEEEWLNKKPDKSLIVPTTLRDFQMLLDNNAQFNNGSPYLGSLACEDFTVSYSAWTGHSSATAKNAYIWSKEVYEGESVNDWVAPYRSIFYCNTILSGLTQIQPDNRALEEYNTVKGSALFFRALSFFDIAELFSKPYNVNAIENPIGIPLKLSDNPSESVDRSTLKDTYSKIISDLMEAEKVLPENVGYLTRPSKIAAKALLARIFLAISDYENAFKYSNEALSIHSELIDFNELDLMSTVPIIKYNKETIFYRQQSTTTLMWSSTADIDTAFFQLFSDNDLRKDIFFRKLSNVIKFKGSYSGSSSLFFTGLATDELYLIRAECYARRNDSTNALKDLNRLLVNRYIKGKFNHITSHNSDSILLNILSERRKELIYRGTRWGDLRRLNQELTYQDTLFRKINSDTYSLLPNDSRYVYAIPENEIYLNPMEQNIR